MLKQPEPMPALPPVAEAGDARVEVKIEALIVRNGPGSWARDASWDEYLVVVRNVSAKSVRIAGFAIDDSLDTRRVQRAERAELVDLSADTERRYKDRGLTVQAGSGSPWLVAAGIGGGTLAFAAGMGSAAAAGGSMMGAVAAGTVFVSTLAIGGIALATYGVLRSLDHREVNQEIGRRHALGPQVLVGNAAARFHVFFPYAPSPSRLVLAYREDATDHVLEIDTTASLAGLHLGTSPPALAPQPAARPASTELQRQLAAVIGEGEARLSYLCRDPSSSSPQEVRLVSSVGRVQSFSDGSRYRDLREVVAFGHLAFEPPVPLAIPGMKVGSRWSHSGRAIDSSLVTQARVDSQFLVEAQQVREMAAGSIPTWRVTERRTIHDATYRLTHWIEVDTLALVSSHAATDVWQVPRIMSHGNFGAPRYDYAIELAPLR